MYCVFFSVGNRFDENRLEVWEKIRDGMWLRFLESKNLRLSGRHAWPPLSSITHYWKSHLRSSKHQATGSREGRYEYNLSPDQTPGRARTGWGREGRGAVQHSGLGESWEWDWGQPGVTERKWQPGQPLKWRVKLSFRINTTGGKLVFWRSEKSRLAFDNCNPC